jgi:class 3 adenylate cyclase
MAVEAPTVGFSQRYWEDAIARVRGTLSEIVSRRRPTMPGRVVPSDSLAIGTGRQLSLAVAFIDICGFSRIQCSTPGEQEAVLATLNLFLTEAISIATDYGGTVEKNTGDGLMAYYPAQELGSEVAACRAAVEASLTLFYVTDNLINPILVNSRLRPILFRVGIDFGTVTVANMGASRRFKGIMAIGTVASVAAKMLDAAGPSQILVGGCVPPRLPPGWQLFCKLHQLSTSFVWYGTNVPYPYYQYTGRWKGPHYG